MTLNDLIELMIELFGGCMLVHIFMYSLKYFTLDKELDVQQVEVVNFKR